MGGLWGGPGREVGGAWVLLHPVLLALSLRGWGWRSSSSFPPLPPALPQPPPRPPLASASVSHASEQAAVTGLRFPGLNSTAPVSRCRCSCEMTLKSSEGEGGNSMRTALSDLYLEHLLQKRNRPEVSWTSGVLGVRVGSRLQAFPSTSGFVLSVASFLGDLPRRT